MPFLESILSGFYYTLLWCIGFGLLFTLLARIVPCNLGMSLWQDRRAMVADAFYWFIMPIFIKLVRIILMGVVAALIFGATDQEAIAQFLEHGHGPISQLPLWVQVIGYLFISDFLLYWAHRWFHTRALWPYHAIHHSPKVLDWFSSHRFHPLNTIGAFVLVDTLLLAIGFAPAALVLLAPFNVVMAAYVHANLNITHGPFKYVLASPVFHRWHHTSVAEGGMKNFAPTFPLIDAVFGTFYMPEGKKPEYYGEEDFPQDIWGQLTYPFEQRKGKKPIATATDLH